MHSIIKNLGSGNRCCDDSHELYTNSENSFRRHDLCRQGENHKFAVDTCGLDLCEDDCYGFLNFVFLVCEVGVMLLLSFERLQVIAPAVDGICDGFHATNNVVMVYQARSLLF